MALILFVTGMKTVINGNAACKWLDLKFTEELNSNLKESEAESFEYWSLSYRLLR